MQTLQRCMLRRQSSIYQQRYAMATLKLYSLANSLKSISFREGQFVSGQMVSNVNSQSTHSIQLENKQLYLRYMQQVLTNKQKELIELEQHLNQRRLIQDKEELQNKIVNPLAINHQAELINQKIETFKEIIKKYHSKNTNIAMRELEDLQKTLVIVEQSCKKNYQILKLNMIDEFQNLNAQRYQLAAKIGKLSELESYEDYLNQLQRALEQKQYQIILRERQLSKHDNGQYSLNNHTLQLKTGQYNTYAEKEESSKNSDHSIRKRMKIFEPRSSIEANVPQQHRQSSKIMQENNSTNNQTHQKVFKSQKIAEQSIPNPKILMTVSSQTVIQDKALQSWQRLNREKLILKFLNLWFNYSQRANKGGAHHKKTMGLYMWRLNALYDGNLKEKIGDNLNWPKKLQCLGQLPNINYQSLSLKKRRYLQLFFDHERRKFQRQKIIVLLKSILKNKNRRERTAIVLYFKRYRHIIRYNSLISIIPNSSQKVLTDKIQNTNMEIQKAKIQNSRVQIQSRVLGNSLSNPTENRMNLLEQSRSSKNKKLGKNSSTTINQSKVKLSLKDQSSSVDIIKLKQYIKSQEEAEVRLAVQCAQMEAAFKIQNTVRGASSRLRYSFLINVLHLGQTAKINALQSSFSSRQFKWELFMAKARLALTNNSNKIAHLEQLISFIGQK